MDFDLITNDAAFTGTPMTAPDLPDGAPEECFDRLTRLAAAALGAPVALISLFDQDRHWFKSRAGNDLGAGIDPVAFCRHVIASRRPLVVEDAGADDRFAASAQLRFYAGHPVFSANGMAIGTLCIAGTEARSLDEAGQRLLYDLAQLVEDEVNKACVVAARDKAELALYTLNEELETRIAERTASLRAASRDLEENEERLRTITDNLPILISYLDSSLTYRFANGCYLPWHGVAPEKMLGRTVEEVFGAEFFGQREAELRRCLQGHTVHLEREVGERCVHSTYIPHLRDGEVVGAYLLSTDVTATRQHEAQLRALANTDSLTGLPNRRHYEAELTMAIERSRRNQRGLALMFLDIDHFKRINDTFGHAGGDSVLKEFARRLKCAVRLTDTVCRLAGDEFTIVLEGLRTREECARIGDCILDVMRSPFTVGGERWQVTTSIGIAWADGNHTGPQQLTAHADAALYEAKEHGRNSYHIDGLKAVPTLLCA